MSFAKMAEYFVQEEMRLRTGAYSFHRASHTHPSRKNIENKQMIFLKDSQFQVDCAIGSNFQ